ncbi:putative F-box protein At3g29830 [Durio zibethinus]|uniref:F-box protein At3g29830 n=1 Tax=Durio zibethinus TaxID=66656 RepID=A0A6P5Y541_DURZI|nr:putative F-box protein At3g29830 [Durio zibethinus]
MKLKMAMAGNEDLSEVLPECLLHIIISFLPFKEAARTSILSKFWLNLWRATKNIEFHESFFVKPEESDATQVMKRRVFIHFVQQWIGNYCESCIDKFALAVSKPENFVADIENFIAFAIAKGVKGLSLDFSDPTWMEDDPKNHEPLFDLPSHVYEHGVLESLKLFSCKIHIPAIKIFSLLKDLSLGWIELQEKSLKALLQHCPLLQSLSLTKCWNMGHFYLSEPSLLLKKLAIENCSFHDPVWIYIKNAPRLQFFKYSGKVASFDLDYLCCWEEADLDFGLESSFNGTADLLYNLLLDLFSVTILSVCSFMLQVISNSRESYGTAFPLNVRHLTLKTALHGHEFSGITFFFDNCPLLQTLTIVLCPARNFPDYEPPFEFIHNFWTKNLKVYKCLRRSLKTVEVKGFKGTANEFLVLQYLIGLGRVMERLNIYISRETDDNGGNVELYRERAQMLLQLNKASKKLQISIY